MNFKKLLRIFLIVLAIILIFAFVDFLAHKLSDEYSVPGYYFRNKIIFGTIIGFISYLLVRKKSIPFRALFFSAAVSILLQVRYYFEGYPKDFVFLFLAVHFAILLPLSWIMFRCCIRREK